MGIIPHTQITVFAFLLVCSSINSALICVSWTTCVAELFPDRIMSQLGFCSVQCCVVNLAHFATGILSLCGSKASTEYPEGTSAPCRIGELTQSLSVPLLGPEYCCLHSSIARANCFPRQSPSHVQERVEVSPWLSAFALCEARWHNFITWALIGTCSPRALAPCPLGPLAGDNDHTACETSESHGHTAGPKGPYFLFT